MIFCFSFQTNSGQYPKRHKFVPVTPDWELAVDFDPLVAVGNIRLESTWVNYKGEQVPL
jgi:hypothetical protein